MTFFIEKTTLLEAFFIPTICHVSDLKNAEANSVITIAMLLLQAEFKAIKHINIGTLGSCAQSQGTFIFSTTIN